MSEPSAPLRSDRHTVTLASTGATTTHPATCHDADTCPYTEAAQRLPVHMLAIGGTWTAGLADDGTLIILARIA